MNPKDNPKAYELPPAADDLDKARRVMAIKAPTYETRISGAQIAIAFALIDIADTMREILKNGIKVDAL